MTDHNTKSPENSDNDVETVNSKLEKAVVSDSTDSSNTKEPSGSEKTVQTDEMTSAAEETPLEKVQKEAEDMKARWLRAVADMENYRKRIAREKQDTIRNAAAKVVESLLPVLDNMKLGLQAAENHPEAKDVVTGFKMVDEQLKRSLEEQGLKELNPDGENFDPNRHECISHQVSEDIEEGKIIQTVRAGYILNERLIRAANVIVSSGPEKT